VFLLTPHHRLILGILEKTGVMSLAHIEALLAATGADIKPDYVKRLVSQLAHMQKIYPATDGIVAASHPINAPPDADMLAAVDIMLDVSGGRPLALKRGTPPYKLCFLAEAECGIGSYAVIAAETGREIELNFALEGMRDEKRVIVLILENERQSKKLTIKSPHFFAIRENEKIRYFEVTPAK
jgi:hypothetical protein